MKLLRILNGDGCDGSGGDSGGGDADREDNGQIGEYDDINNEEEENFGDHDTYVTTH